MEKTKKNNPARLVQGPGTNAYSIYQFVLFCVNDNKDGDVSKSPIYPTDNESCKNNGNIRETRVFGILLKINL